MSECKMKQNRAKCNCSYEPCSRKGICCECIQYHLPMGQFPACFFSDHIEATYDRSINKFIKSYQGRGR
ncbi:MAG: DUF6485 family protein [Candidatus Omnitrophota bacterium]